MSWKITSVVAQLQLSTEHYSVKYYRSIQADLWTRFGFLRKNPILKNQVVDNNGKSGDYKSSKENQVPLINNHVISGVFTNCVQIQIRKLEI